MACGNNIYVAYFYFDYNDQEGTSDANVIRCLLRQFLTGLQFTPADVEALYDNFVRHATVPDQAAFSKGLISCISHFEHPIVVLDALDECRTEALNVVISLIGRLKDADVRILASGRPYATNTLALLDNPPELVIRPDKEDVRRYLSHRLINEWRYGDKFGRKIEEAVARQVIDSRAPEKYIPHFKNFKGAKVCRFMMAKVLLDYALNESNPRDVIYSLAGLRWADSLDSIYRAILDKIEKGNQKALALTVLSWLVHARRPMHMEEIREILCVRSSDRELYTELLMPPELIVQSCQGLVIFDERSGIIRLAHITVLQFLQSGQCREKLLSSKDLAKVCLAYLTFNAFARPCLDCESFTQRRQIYGFFDYAVKFWGYHTKGEGEKDRELLFALFSFLQNPVRRAAIRQHQMNELSKVQELSQWTALHMLAEEGLLATYNLLSKFRRVDPIGNIMRFARSPRMPTIDILPVLSDEEIPDVELGDKDAQDNYGNTPLHLAAGNGHVDMTKALLDRGASLEIHNHVANFSALHVAASKGYKEVVALLLAKGSRLETRFENEQTSGTSLTIAAEFGRSEVVRTLLRANADPQAKTRSGNTALHIAASKGYAQVVKELLSNKKTDVKARTPSGTTALHLAASNGHQDIVMALLHKGADPNERDNTGWTAAHRAAAGGHKKVVMTLLHVSGDIEHQIVLLFMLVDKFPEDHIYPKLLGDTLCKSGNFEDAVEAYNTATGVNPSNKGALRIEDIQHSDVTCFSCQRKVTGIWYHCVSCEQLEMCDDCYNIQSHSEETGHQIMGIPSRQWLQSAGLIDGS